MMKRMAAALAASKSPNKSAVAKDLMALSDAINGNKKAEVYLLNKLAFDQDQDERTELSDDVFIEFQKHYLDWAGQFVYSQTLKMDGDHDHFIPNYITNGGGNESMPPFKGIMVPFNISIDKDGKVVISYEDKYVPQGISYSFFPAKARGNWSKPIGDSFEYFTDNCPEMANFIQDNM